MTAGPIEPEEIARFQAIAARLSVPIPLPQTPPPRERKTWHGAKVGDTFRLAVDYYDPPVGHVPAGQWWRVERITSDGAVLRCVRADPYTLDVSRCKIGADWLWKEEWIPTWKRIDKREVQKWTGSTSAKSDAGIAETPKSDSTETSSTARQENGKSERSTECARTVAEEVF